MKQFFLIISAIMLFAFLSCSKNGESFRPDPVDVSGLSGTDWRPIHASGETLSGNSSITWDGDIDENGELVVHLNVNGTERDMKLSFMGISFRRKNERNLFGRFYTADKNYTMIYYLRYKVENGYLYLEKVASGGSGNISSSSSSVIEMKGSDEYDSYLIDELTSTTLRFNGVTYERTD